MHLPLISTLSILLLGFCLPAPAQSWKEMMYDPSINIYEVIDSAEAYFSHHPKGKGSGYKDFHRWKYDSELLFWPSGDRSNFDPRAAIESTRQWIKDHESTPEHRSGGSQPWVEMGPQSANNVLDHHNPGMGRIDAVWVDPADTNRMYIGARNGGFWRSADGGQTWANSTDQLSQLGVNTIAVSPASADTVLIDMRVDPTVDIAGIFRSFDGGLSWTPAAWNLVAPANLSIHKLLFNPQQGGEAYAVTSQGLFRSVDYFQTWDTLSGSYCIDMAFRPGSADTFYLARFQGLNQLWVTHNRGQSFQSVSANGAAHTDTHLGVSAANPDVVYICHPNGISRSLDGAQSFSNLSTFLPDWLGSFGVSDNDPNLLIYGGIDTWISTNAGGFWSMVAAWNNPAHPEYIHADLREVYTTGSDICIGTDGYFARSRNGGVNWDRLSDGVGTREFYRIGVSPTHHSLVIGGSQDNGTSYTWQGDWYEWLGADGMECAVNRSNPFQLYGEQQWGGIHRTDDFGVTSISLNQGFIFGPWITALAFDQNHPCTFYVGNNPMRKTTDNGQTFTNPPGFNFLVEDMEIPAKNSQLIYATIQNQVFKSTDGGQTSSEITATLPNVIITDIAAHPRHNDTIAVCYATYASGQQVYWSTNGGSSWSNISYNMPTIPAYDLVFDDGHLYMGTRAGVFYHDLGSNVWNSWNDNLPYVFTRELEIHKGTNTLRAGTYGRGLWERCLIGTESKPRIKTIETAPFVTLSRPTEHSDVDIVCTIEDSIGIQSAWIRWSANTTSFANAIALSQAIADTFKTVTKIPAQSAGSTVHFIVYAVNMSADTTESDRIVYKTWPYDCTQNTIPLSISGPSGICAGDTATLTAAGAFEYTWNPGLGAGASHSVSPAATTTWTVRATDEDGCMDSASYTLNIGTASVNLGADTSFCDGTAFSIPLNAGPGAGSYLWSTGDTTQSIQATTYGVYAVTVSNLGCTAEDSLLVQALPLPQVGISFAMDTVCLTAGPIALTGGTPGGGSWSGPGVSGTTFDPQGAGPGTHAIAYSYTDANGCSDDTTANLVVEICVGIVDSISAAVALYPNPSGQAAFYLESPGINRMVVVEVADLKGRRIFSRKTEMAGKLYIELPDGLPAGNYIVRLSDPDSGSWVYQGKWRYLGR